MREEFLHQVWNDNNINSLHFNSVDGQSIKIIDKGYYNQNSGPDFINASIAVNGIAWHGHIEMHLKSSDWNKHYHSKDAAYDNVILHLVYECDEPVFTKSGVELLQAELKNIINKEAFQKTNKINLQNIQLACSGQLNKIPTIIIEDQKQSMCINRLEARYNYVKTFLNEQNTDWEQVSYILLARAFGTNINQHAFLKLAERITYKKLKRWSVNTFQVEAVLLNASGLIEAQNSSYAKDLKKTASQFFIKHDIDPMYAMEWKFNRMRPSSFPTIRISQFANLITREQNIFSKIIESKNTNELRNLLHTNASEYWDNHFNFNLLSKNCTIKSTSNEFIDKIIINACVPLVFTYGKLRNDYTLTEKALSWLENLPKESNKITKKFEQCGIMNKTAFDSQSILELHQNYCLHKKCLSCRIGNACIK